MDSSSSALRRLSVKRSLFSFIRAIRSASSSSVSLGCGVILAVAREPYTARRKEPRYLLHASRQCAVGGLANTVSVGQIPVSTGSNLLWYRIFTTFLLRPLFVLARTCPLASSTALMLHRSTPPLPRLERETHRAPGPQSSATTTTTTTTARNLAARLSWCGWRWLWRSDDFAVEEIVGAAGLREVVHVGAGGLEGIS